MSWGELEKEFEKIATRSEPPKSKRAPRKPPGVDTVVVELWEQKLQADKGGASWARILLNVELILRNAKELRGVIAFDDFSQRLVATRESPAGAAGPWTDDHDLHTTIWLQGSKWKLEVGDDLVARAVRAVAARQRVHPLRDRLTALRWDGVPRVDTWTTTYLGAEDNTVHRAIGATWLIGAVARAFKPGCKVDAALILEGTQGAGKSTALRILSLGFFSDELADLGNKDAAMQLQGAWIHELAELDAVNRAEATRVKSFLTRNADRYRPPWGRHVIEVPRQCVFAGSTNHDEWQRDETGGRRFLPVRVGTIDLDALRRDVEQLWAETVARHNNGEQPYIANPDLVTQLREHTAQRFQADVWHTTLERFAQVRDSISVEECLVHLGIETGRWTQSDKNRVAKTLLSLGYRRVKTNKNGRREWRYSLDRLGLVGSDWGASQTEKMGSKPTGPSSPNANKYIIGTGAGEPGERYEDPVQLGPTGTIEIDAPARWEGDQ